MSAAAAPAKPKRRYPRAAALAVARELCQRLAPVTARLIVAGSLRRRKTEVGDVEVLFIPRFELRAVDLLQSAPVDLASELIEQLVARGALEKRLSVTGAQAWGAKNKLAVHVASGIPVDLFTATEANWFNYLVCRTGGAQSNLQLAAAAKARGWQWNPYGPGFTDPEHNLVPVTCEADVFQLAGLPYREPWERR